jgi:hypothetical protein
MATRTPVLGLLRIYKADISLVYEGRGLERLAGRLLGHLLGGQLSEFVIDEWEKLLGGLAVTILDLR